MKSACSSRRIAGGHDPDLVVGGLAALTTIDFPARLAAVIFCQGCPWRCRYCHNRDLLGVRADGAIPWATIDSFLQRRRGLLDAVVFSGGEPTMQRALPTAVRRVAALGYEIGLHTAGGYPAQLERVLPDIDWIGMDVKAPFEDYSAVTGVPGSGDRARQCSRLVLDAGVAHEFRTTLDATLMTDDRLLRLAAALAELGVEHYAVQNQRDPGTSRVTQRLDDATAARIAPLFRTFEVR